MMSNPLQEASAFYDRLQSLSCIDECWAVFLQEVQSFGFDWAYYGFVHPLGNNDEPEVTYITNFSKEWQDEYERLGGANNDIGVRHCLASTEDHVFFEPAVLAELPPEQYAIEEFAMRSGIHNGIAFPLRTGPELSDWGGLGLSTRMNDATFHSVLAQHGSYLRLISQIFHAIIQSRPLAQNILLLTEAEKEVLALTGRGCTTKEIANQLGETDKAINKRIERAAKKLASSTRTQAVAEAIRLHIIRL